MHMHPKPLMVLYLECVLYVPPRSHGGKEILKLGSDLIDDGIGETASRVRVTVV